MKRNAYSVYALSPLTVIFLPENRAEAELAESVMKESRLIMRAGSIRKSHEWVI